MKAFLTFCALAPLVFMRFLTENWAQAQRF